jgi:peptidoglycan hydrolase-like protein with peptidoglycan-binding domain
MVRSTVGVAFVVAAVLVGAACDKKQPENTSLGAAASSIKAEAPPASAKVVKYAIDPKGKTSIDMPAPKEHIKADTSAAGGTFDVDLMNLGNSRGEVKVDLSTLTTHTFDSQKDNDSQTTHARTWLEVVVDGKMHEENRWAVLAISKVDGLSATDVTKIAPTKDGEDDVRSVTATVHGDFLVHGHKVPKDVAVAVKFRYPSGAAADSKPTSIELKTTTPLRITLADHDVKPRDSFGSLAQGALGLLGTKVADVADVSIDLKGTLAP